MKLIDLSYPIDSSLPHHPYDEPVKLCQDKFLDRDKFNNYRLETGMHAGTHVDSPMHLTDSKTFINEYPLERFCGEAAVLDAGGASVLQYKDEYDALVRPGDIVIISTGHEKSFGSPEYFTAHPVLSAEFAQRLIEKKIKIAGFDLPSPDAYPFEIHAMFFAHGIFILENLRNLEVMHGRRVRIYAFPLNIRADSSPVRVVAEVRQS